MNVTDSELGMAYAFGDRLRHEQRAAQRVVNTKDQEIALLMGALRRAREELAHERGKRIAAEMRLEALLDLEI
jgi:hypothetical protein